MNEICIHIEDGCCADAVLYCTSMRKREIPLKTSHFIFHWRRFILCVALVFERKWAVNFGTRRWFTFSHVVVAAFYRFLIEMNEFIWTFMMVSRSPMVLNGSWFIVGKVFCWCGSSEGISNALDRNYSCRGMLGMRFN